MFLPHACRRSEAVFLVCDCRDDDSCMWASIITNGDFSNVDKCDLEDDLKPFRADAWCVHCQVAEKLFEFMKLNDRVNAKLPGVINQVQVSPLVAIVNDSTDGFCYCVNETSHHRLVCTCGHARCGHVKTVALELLGIGDDEHEEEDRIAILSKDSDCSCKNTISFSHIPHVYSAEFVSTTRAPVLMLPGELVPSLRSCDCGTDYGCYYPCLIHDLAVPLHSPPSSQADWDLAPSHVHSATEVSRQRVSLLCADSVLSHRKASTDREHKLVACTLTACVDCFYHCHTCLLRWFV